MLGPIVINALFLFLAVSVKSYAAPIAEINNFWDKNKASEFDSCNASDAEYKLGELTRQLNSQAINGSKEDIQFTINSINLGFYRCIRRTLLGDSTWFQTDTSRLDYRLNSMYGRSKFLRSLNALKEKAKAERVAESCDSFYNDLQRSIKAAKNGDGLEDDDILPIKQARQSYVLCELKKIRSDALDNTHRIVEKHIPVVSGNVNYGALKVELSREAEAYHDRVASAEKIRVARENALRHEAAARAEAEAVERQKQMEYLESISAD